MPITPELLNRLLKDYHSPGDMFCGDPLKILRGLRIFYTILICVEPVLFLQRVFLEAYGRNGFVYELISIFDGGANDLSPQAMHLPFGGIFSYN